MPSGTSDPYALRRQAIGVIQIMLAGVFQASLRHLIRKSLELLYDKISQDTVETEDRVLTFFQHRIEHLLAEEGFSKDVIAAVVSVSMDDVPAVRSRTEALEALKTEPDFEPLAVAFKRVVNIIRQAKEKGDLQPLPGGQEAAADSSLFQHREEHELYQAFHEVRNDIAEDLRNRAFDRALVKVAGLKGPVDIFFDGVMVLTEDENLKRNRLALLGEIAALFNIFADFSRIST
jgi:glycyl-tRNA synthetase beta chain